jgi:LysR family transcriptional regulator, nod-box dependent transcriptional activator
MHFRNFDLNLLVALDALLTERNVTRAAERLFVSQPAMSNALQRIRDQFKDQILVREGREMMPTPLAQSLIAPVREMLLQSARLLEADYDFHPREAKRTFRILMSDYCATVLMGPLVKILYNEAPGLRCEALPLTGRTIAALLGGEADMCITAQDLRLLDPEADAALFGHVTLFEDEFVCAVDAAHPDVGEALDLETFLRLPHAVMRFGESALSLEEQTLKRLDLDFPITAVAPTFSSLPMLLSGTPLIITIQRKLLNRLSAAVPMRAFTPPIAIPRLVETLYWHHRSEHDKAHAWLREAIGRAASMLDSPPAD